MTKNTRRPARDLSTLRCRISERRTFGAARSAVVTGTPESAEAGEWTARATRYFT